MGILIKGGAVVNAYGRWQADVLTEGDRIVGIGENLEADAEVIDASGCFVLPGFIDTHTHFDLDVGLAVTADDFDTGTRAAILGGTTTILDFATQDRDGTLKEALDTWRRKAGGSHCNYGFHMAIARWDEGVEREMVDMDRAGVTSYKLYMVYDALRLDDGKIYEAMKASTKHGALVGAHCENWEVLQSRIRELRELKVSAPWGHAYSRPPEVEAEAVARFLRIAQLAKAPAYVVHLSTVEGMAEADRARRRGQEVYLETCPQYLLLSEELYREEDGAKYVMSPPLRRGADLNGMWLGLRKGHIDTIGTDHCSFTMAQKAIGKEDFTKIPNGGAGVQHRGQLIYTYGVFRNRIKLEQMVKYLSYNPARLFGMADRGEIAVGRAADIVVWDPKYLGRIDAAQAAHNCDNSPFDGMGVRGRARDVLLNGEAAVSGGELTLRGRGKYIARTRYQKLR